MTRLFILTAVLIVYASLFPWQFHAVKPGVNPASLVLHTWLMHRPLAAVMEDVAVNMLAYIPLGLFACLSLASAGFCPAKAAWGGVAIGFVLSFAIEFTQAFVPGRNSNGLDVTCNTAGAALGVGVALLWIRVPHRNAKRPDAVCLLGCWTAAMLFPFATRWFSGKLALTFRPVDMLQDFAATLALATLVNSIGRDPRRRRMLLGALLLIVPVRAIVAPRTVTAGTLVAVAAGFALAYFVRLTPAVIAALLASAIAIHGLAPFKLLAQPKPFSWMPFKSSLMSNPESGLTVLLGKLFLYGSLVWLLRESRMPWIAAALLSASLLATIEVIQRWIPGRTPEITDPIVALILAWTLWSLRPGPRKQERLGSS